MKKASGFTLIELISVIVILGILSTIALGKFISLGSAAKAATIQALADELRTTAEIAHASCIVSPACDESASTTFFTMDDGKIYRFNYGWPDAGNKVSGLQIDSLIITTGYRITDISNSTTLFEVESATVPANCSVAYVDAFHGGGKVIITPKTSGC